MNEFQPEYAGKLNFYLNAKEVQLRHRNDNSSISILLCKTPNKVVVEYSLKNLTAPLGVAESNYSRGIERGVARHRRARKRVGKKTT